MKNIRSKGVFFVFVFFLILKVQAKTLLIVDLEPEKWQAKISADNSFLSLQLLKDSLSIVVERGNAEIVYIANDTTDLLGWGNPFKNLERLQFPKGENLAIPASEDQMIEKRDVVLNAITRKEPSLVVILNYSNADIESMYGKMELLFPSISFQHLEFKESLGMPEMDQDNLRKLSEVMSVDLSAQIASAKTSAITTVGGCDSSIVFKLF